MTLHSRLAALVVALLAVGCTHLAPVADDASPDTAPAVTADSAAIDAIPPAPDITPPGSDVPAAPPTMAERAVKHALAVIGSPYRFGGTSPAGFDCSGLVRYSFALAGLELPRDTREQRRSSRVLGRDEQPRTGDLLFFKRGRRDNNLHVGIYLGEGRFVHSPSRGGAVRIERLDDAHWRRTFIDARRVGVERQLRAGHRRTGKHRLGTIGPHRHRKARACRTHRGTAGRRRTAAPRIIEVDAAASGARSSHITIAGLRFATDLP
jgi:murein DD-endopeptidase